MPQMQRIPGYVARTFLINGVFAVIGMSSFGLMFYACIHNDFGVKFKLGIGGFIGSVFAMLIIQAVRARRFRCPKCGQHIPVRYRDSGSTWNKGRYRVQFLCPHCDIIWDTGLRTG